MRMKRLAQIFLAGLLFCGAYLLAQNQTTTLPKLKSGDPLPAGLFIDLAKVVNPSVVNIFTTYLPKGRTVRNDSYRDPFFDMFEQFLGPQGFGQATPQQALGTGFIIREDGLIITNNHVIDRADVIKVQLEERTKESFDAKLVGKDPRTDIALIKIDAKRKLPFAKMGSSADVQVGEWVAAFGNPYGYGHTMTKGIISALGREIDELNLNNPFMQTDASINPGNSGGPLVNTQGLVIGVNAAIDARAQGIGFVIPIDSVKQLLPALEKDGTIKRGFLGVNLQDIDEEGARMLNLKQTEGALVAGVVPGSPAERGGLEPYDLITEFAERKIADSRDLTKAVSSAAVGSQVSVKVIRNGKPRTLKVTISTPENLKALTKPPKAGKSLGQAAPYGLGFATIDYTPAVAEEYHLPLLRQPRPVIVAVEANSEAARAGLAPGDIVLDINRKEVARSRDVGPALRKGTINILRILKLDRVVLVSLRAQ